MSVKFAVEENKNFILKLTFESSNRDDCKTRRVKLPRIVGSNGRVSYEELVGLVIRLNFPAVNDTLLSNEKKFYKVELTYCDIDSDLIHLGSTEELIDAFEQYSEQHFVRINAKVEKQRSTQQQHQQKQHKQVSVIESTLPDGSTDTISSKAVAVPSTSPDQLRNVEPHIMSPLVMSQIACYRSTLGSASVAIDESNSSAISRPFTTHDASTTNRSEKMSSINILSRNEQKNAAASSDKVVKPVVKSIVDDKNRATANHVQSVIFKVGLKQISPSDEIEKTTTTKHKKDSIINNNNNGNDNSKNDNRNQEIEKKIDEGKDKDEKGQAKPSFIHYRHTCDLCMTNPIVGDRFHASNSHDYDLCEMCHNAYEGEIQFEVKILDRDRPFQKRWQWHRKKHDAFWRQQNNPLYCPTKDSSSPSFGVIYPRRCWDYQPYLQGQAGNNIDVEPKETNQHSSEDKSTDRNVNPVPKTTEKQTVADNLVVCSDTLQSSSENGKNVPPVCTEEDEQTPSLKLENHCAKTEVTTSIAGNEEKKTVDTNWTKEDSNNQSKTQMKSRYGDIIGRATNEKNGNKGTRTKEKENIDHETSVKEEKQDALTEKKTLPFQNKKVTVDECQATSEEEECAEEHNSFKSETAGNKRVAGIPDMDTFAIDHAAGVRVEYGAIVLKPMKSSQGDKADAQSEEGSKEDKIVDIWQVVNEIRNDTTQNEDTELITVATQLIGSSLFNSGMDSHNSREEENVSVLATCSVSSASSVSTESLVSIESSVSTDSSDSSASSVSSASSISSASSVTSFFLIEG